jgi:hypothetical protein
LLIVLTLALGGLFVANEAQAYPRARFYRGYNYGPAYRVGYGPRVYGPRVYGYRYAPRYAVYSPLYPRTYSGWWGYAPAPYYYGGPHVYYGGYYGW